MPSAHRLCPRPPNPSLGDADRVCSANRSIPHWKRLLSAFSFDEVGAKEKAIKKKNAAIDISRSAERDKDSALRTRKPLKRLDLNFKRKGGAKTLIVVEIMAGENFYYGGQKIFDK